jgi:hypothetical protein
MPPSLSLTPIELFDKMRGMRTLRKVFEEPEKITEDSRREGIDIEA